MKRNPSITSISSFKTVLWTISSRISLELSSKTSSLIKQRHRSDKILLKQSQRISQLRRAKKVFLHRKSTWSCHSCTSMKLKIKTKMNNTQIFSVILPLKRFTSEKGNSDGDHRFARKRLQWSCLFISLMVHLFNQFLKCGLTHSQSARLKIQNLPKKHYKLLKKRSMFVITVWALHG